MDLCGPPAPRLSSAMNKKVEEEVEDNGVEEEEGGGGSGELGFEEGDIKKKKVVVVVGGSARRGSGSSGGVEGGGGVSRPRCQVEKCAADLTNAKRYHRRHKVCEVHSKAPVVIFAGLQQRFCQQCSRFHELSEFDGAKRSCRRRLAGHNERRRKSSSEVHREGSSRRGLRLQLRQNQHRQNEERERVENQRTLPRSPTFKHYHSS
ncbi:hypothetical protein F0562_008953 [Nyssa sinensis]|uniref:SBP-type domain-containing protein n=1 Tax=Nyssa sinensis TaxID=561372 RepID=A0A5J5A9U9_9ASTE|nr:hypothetical protein F0562_008953 [Nyssa sinensis]